VGNLLYYLGKETVLNRLDAIQFDVSSVWKACSITWDELIDYSKVNKEKIIETHLLTGQIMNSLVSNLFLK
jgi:hypothetical protein